MRVDELTSCALIAFVCGVMGDYHGDGGGCPAVVTTLAGSSGGGGAFADGKGTQARFSSPIGVAVDLSGAVFVTDFGNQRIRKITPDGGTFFQVSGLVWMLCGTGPSCQHGQGPHPPHPNASRCCTQSFRGCVCVCVCVTYHPCTRCHNLGRRT